MVGAYRSSYVVSTDLSVIWLIITVRQYSGMTSEEAISSHVNAR